MTTSPKDPDLHSLTTMDLFESIGRDLTGTPALPPSREELVAKGRAWHEANVGKIRKIVCPHSAELLKETNFEKLITIIADMLAAATFSVAPVKIAVLTVRIGVEKLCPPAAVPQRSGA